MAIELQKYSGKDSRHQCPACNDKSSFVYYIDTETKLPIHRTCGKCNRESGCGYHYTPKQYFIDNPKEKTERKDWTPPPPRKEEPPRPMGNLSFDLVERSKSTDSNFVRFLIDLLNDNSKVVQLCQLYKVGATKAKEVIFWQVDESNKVRTGKVMQYDPTNGKRSKTQTLDWIHSRMQKANLLPADYNLKQCFFGQHLLTDKTKNVAVVESEKTAIIASGLMPDFIWIAAGALQGLNIDKCSCLEFRNVVLFPDLSEKHENRLNAFEIWSAKASEIMKAYKCKVIVSDLLERNAIATDRQKGFDIADYFILEKRRREPQNEVKPVSPEVKPVSPEAQSLKVEPINKKSLLEIGFDIVGEQNNLTKNRFLAEMIKRYSISDSRAAKGFDLLLKNNIIEPTNVDTYFLSQSIPF